MKKIILTLIMIIVMSGAASAFVDSYTIERSKLPEAAQEMLDTYFPKTKVGMIKVDRHLLKKTDYDVRLIDGTTIEFNNSGKWTSVNCKTKAVPEGLIPKSIRNYVDKNFPSLKIVSISKSTGGYEAGLSDGVILKFNLLGQFKSASIEE